MGHLGCSGSSSKPYTPIPLSAELSEGSPFQLVGDVRQQGLGFREVLRPSACGRVCACFVRFLYHVLIVAVVRVAAAAVFGLPFVCC